MGFQMAIDPEQDEYKGLTSLHEMNRMASHGTWLNVDIHAEDVALEDSRMGTAILFFILLVLFAIPS